MSIGITRRPGVLGPFTVSVAVGRLWLGMLLLLCAEIAWGQEGEGLALQDIHFSSLSGGRVQLVLSLSSTPPHPVSFTVDNPARIALDLPGVENQLKQRSRTVGLGVARSIATAQARGRTRVVVNLVHLVPFETRVDGNDVVVILDGKGDFAVSNQPEQAGSQPRSATSAMPVAKSIRQVDFRRGEAGVGKVQVELSDSSIPVDVQMEGDKIVVDFKNASLPGRLERRLDVTDFATAVHTVDTYANGDDVRLEIMAEGSYDHFAYQSENTFTVEVKPMSKGQIEAQRKEKFGFAGERLSLNFQNIEVRAVLQLIAEFTGQNLVVSDTVSGSVTLRLKNVPWDQALDIILRTHGLAMRQQGNVMMVAPAAEVAGLERQELEAQNQVQELAPLQTELIPISYARAEDIAPILQSDTASMISSRGSVTVDARTNTLLVRETGQNIESIRRLVEQLDVPVRQVMIESRIVVADNNFSKDLGVRFGATTFAQVGQDNGLLTTTGSATGTDSMALTNATQLPVANTVTPEPVDIPAQSDRYNVNLPISSPAGQIAFALLGRSFLLDLELQAMQAEGRGEIISNPRVITGNNQAATISQGQTITFVATTADGSSTAPITANLSLNVTPQITPDDNILMELTITDDSAASVTPTVITTNNRQISTNVLVEDGQTLVLGGVYQQTRSDGTTKVPVLGDIPVFGALFRSTTKTDNKRELLVFVTPAIIRDGSGRAAR